MQNTRKSFEYQRGYEDGFKEGYNKALEYLIEQQKYSTGTQIVVQVDDIEEANGLIK